MTRGQVAVSLNHPECSASRRVPGAYEGRRQPMTRRDARVCLSPCHVKPSNRLTSLPADVRVVRAAATALSKILDSRPMKKWRPDNSRPRLPSEHCLLSATASRVASLEERVT